MPARCSWRGKDSRQVMCNGKVCGTVLRLLSHVVACSADTSRVQYFGTYAEAQQAIETWHRHASPECPKYCATAHIPLGCDACWQEGA